MSPSASVRESREYAPLVRFGGSLPNSGWLRCDGASPIGTQAQPVPGPADRSRRQVRLSPSPRAAMRGFALSREHSGQGSFLQ
jgi:hypothetical protein